MSTIAAETLGRIHASSELAIPALIELLHRKELLLQYQAEESLVVIAKALTHAPEELMEATRNRSDPDVRLRLLNVISELDALSESAVSRIAELLADTDPHVRQRAAEVLANRSTDDPAVLSALETALKDPETSVRVAAMLALERLAPGSPATFGAAEQLMQSDEIQLRLSAGLVLAGHGIDAGRAVVREALRGEDGKTRQIALNVLNKMPGTTEEFRADIEPLLKSGDGNTQRAAAELLIEGPSSDEAIETLSLLLNQGQPVANILRRAARRAAAAIPALQRAVELGVGSAIPVLCEIAPVDVSIRSVQQALLQARPQVRAAAAAAVSGLGQAPDEVLKRLIELSHDPDAYVRVAARSALARLSNVAAKTMA